MRQKIITNSASQTQKLGEKLALRLYLRQVKEIKNRKSAVVLGLEGDLGGGKTTFLQGFAKGLGVKEKILSPTFVIIKKFQIPNSRFSNFYHIDCYRINKAQDIGELGFGDIVLDPKNIVAIEWPEKIKKKLFKPTIVIKFDFIHPERSRRVDKNKREVVINF